jgi:O-antigen/teichoic acid export membrane protein
VTVSNGDVATRAAVRGSSMLLGGQLFATLVNLAAQIVIVRVLSKEGYGAFAYALAVLAVGEAVADFGLRRGVSRFLPIYEERGEHGRAMGTLVFATAAVVSLGAAVALVVVGLRHAIAGSISESEDAARLVAILILLAPVHALQTVADAAFAAFGRPRAILLRGYVYTPVMRLALAATLVLADRGTTFLATGYVVTGLIGIIIYVRFLMAATRERGLTRRAQTQGLVVPVRELLRFTTPLLTNDLAAALLGATAAILLGVLAGAEDVALLRAVLPVSLTLTYVLAAFGTLFTPLAARMYARADSAGLDRLYWQTAAWTAVLSFPLFAISFAFAEPLVVLLFGASYADSANVLAVLVTGHFVTAALGPNGVLLGVHAETRYIVTTNVVAVVVNLVLSFALIPVLGALGAAIAGSVTLVLLNVLRQVGLARRTPVRAFARDYVALFTLLLGLTAALFVSNVLLAPSLELALVLVAGASLALIAYAHRRLDLGGTFPELVRLPVVGRFLTADEP